MVPEIEKSRITEIHVRMDCNGCVQKIKKALHGINGIYNITIDFPRQTLTVIGWADPEKIIKAIKKRRKIATICSHKEIDPPAPPPAPADGGDPPPPQTETPPASEPSPPAEPPKEAPPPPPQSETTTAPKEETITTPPPAATTAEPAQDQPPPPSEPPKDVEEIRILHHHPNQYYGYYSGGGHGFPQLQEARPYHVMTHNYNTYQPSSSVSEYLHGYQRSPATQYIEHARIEYVDGEDNIYQGRDRRDGNQIITSIFSDENPNACAIS